MWLLIGIDYQYQTIHKLVSIGIDCLQMDGKVIVNTFHFNVNRRIILSSFSLMLTPHCRNPFSFFDKLKVCSVGQSIDFKNRRVMALCLHRKILVTEVVLLQTMKLPTTAASVVSK